MLLQARTLGQLTGSVESRYLDTYSGILALEADKATVARLTLRTGGQAGAAEARRPPTRPSRDKREAAEERKKPPMKTMSSGSLLKEYRVEKQRPATPSVPEEAEVSDDSIGPALALLMLNVCTVTSWRVTSTRPRCCCRRRCGAARCSCGWGRGGRGSRT